METCDPVMSLTFFWRAASNARTIPYTPLRSVMAIAGSPEPGCCFDELLGMTCTLQEREVGLAPERSVHGAASVDRALDPGGTASPVHEEPGDAAR